MLQGTLSLHDIEDVELYCARIVRSRASDLEWADREDLHAFLIETCWEISLDYKPGIIRQGFSTWASHALGRKLIDWRRQRFGRSKWQFKDRTYERPRPGFVPLDDRPEQADPSISLDTEASDLQDLLGLDGGRDRRSLRRDDTLGTAAQSKAA